LFDLKKSNANIGYWSVLREGIVTSFGGLKLTWLHFKNGLIKQRRPAIGVEDPDYFKYHSGLFTLQYPNEAFPVPDNGRYRLDNIIDDCIVCDKCAKICPVNCIEIEAIKSTEEIRKTSDGSSVRLYAAKFNIDMAKCCFCGLCTTVCPTECLTMSKTFDFSEFDVRNLNYAYSEMTTVEIEEKNQLYASSQLLKKQVSSLKSTKPTEE
jgi:formate hydrogenlyase subunit 6/NADH:ubiquinone oxidoreductase subunit I